MRAVATQVFRVMEEPTPGRNAVTQPAEPGFCHADSTGPVSTGTGAAVAGLGGGAVTKGRRAA
jgi:hypothetical protein